MAAIHNSTRHPRFDGVARQLAGLLVEAGLHTDYAMMECSGNCDYCEAICNAGQEEYEVLRDGSFGVSDGFAFGHEVQRLGMCHGEDYATDECIELLERLG